MRALFLTAAAAAMLASGALAEPQRFDSPDAAVDALVAALRAGDRAAALAVFGPEAEDVVLTGEDAADRDAWTSFLAAHDALRRIDGPADGPATLYVGRDAWPLPIPIARDADGRWSFDADAAREEVFLRRIGRNELDAIATLRAYLEVQAAYRRVDHDDDGVMEFAAAVASTPGARDGLWWPTGPDGVASPVGDMAGAADAATADPEPLHGYLYRILTAQGAAAPGGAMDYLVNGQMVAGHALIAHPWRYGETGVMSFLVGENGVVLEADLGADTAAAAAAIDAFDPVEGWTPLD